jgi:hypothetical protein
MFDIDNIIKQRYLLIQASLILKADILFSCSHLPCVPEFEQATTEI